MDGIHKFMNILLPPIVFTFLLFFLPPFFVFKLLRSIKRSIYGENLAGKVVVVTGASSGIGEYLACEYGGRGACLALAGRREDRLQAVADKARLMGSPDVIVVLADITKVEDCKRLIDDTVNHFQKPDHLVNNAGILGLGMFGDCSCNQISDNEALMKTNFWGPAYTTHFALPHLRKSKGRIIVIASAGGWWAVPKMSFYGASKAAVINFYETLRAEFGSDIGITIVTPGVIKSDVSQGDPEAKGHLNFWPPESTEGCTKAIVNSARRGERFLIEPSWARMLFVLQVICPEVVEWCSRLLIVDKTSKKNA